MMNSSGGSSMSANFIHAVTVAVADSGGLSTAHTYALVVAATNDLPVIESRFPTDTLVVVADGPGEIPAPRVGATRTRIELESVAGADLVEILGQSAGFQIRRYGAAGASAVPSLRGSAPAQVRVFVDGLPLDDAQTGLVDLARLPVERFAAVEIHRGSVPTGFGGAGGIGAVNLMTRRAASGLDLAVGAGSFGEVRGRMVWSRAPAHARNSVLLLFHGRRAENDFTFVHDNRTLHRTDDDRTVRRENSWLREHGGFLKGHVDVTERLRLAAQADLGYRYLSAGYEPTGRGGSELRLRGKGMLAGVTFRF